MAKSNETLKKMHESSSLHIFLRYYNESTVKMRMIFIILAKYHFQNVRYMI